MEGRSVLLVDAVPQGSAQAWSRVRTKPPLFPVVGMAKSTLHHEIVGLARGYHVTIIDGAPRANQLARSESAAVGSLEGAGAADDPASAACSNFGVCR